MANWENLIQEVSDVIKPNNSQAITGQVLQNSLINIIESLGEGAVFKGVIDSNNPTPPEFDGPCFCIYKCKTGEGKTLTAFSRIYVSAYATVLLYTNDNTTWQYVELSRMYNSTVANSGLVNLHARDAKINSATIDTDSLRVESHYGSSYPLIEINDSKVAIGTSTMADFKRLLIEDYKFRAGTPNGGSIISIIGTGASLSIGAESIAMSMGTGADDTVEIRGGVNIGPNQAPTTFENDNKVYLGPSVKIGTGIAIYRNSDSGLTIKDLVTGKMTNIPLS